MGVYQPLQWAWLGLRALVAAASTEFVMEAPRAEASEAPPTPTFKTLAIVGQFRWA
jgi:hypothetical protein